MWAVATGRRSFARGHLSAVVFVTSTSSPATALGAAPAGHGRRWSATWEGRSPTKEDKNEAGRAHGLTVVVAPTVRLTTDTHTTRTSLTSCAVAVQQRLFPAGSPVGVARVVLARGGGMVLPTEQRLQPSAA